MRLRRDCSIRRGPSSERNKCGGGDLKKCAIAVVLRKGSEVGEFRANVTCLVFGCFLETSWSEESVSVQMCFGRFIVR